jgi:hypothetical protein
VKLVTETMADPITEQRPVNKWPIGLCQCGRCDWCMFACFCPCCAAAEARHRLDDSPCMFNFFCLSLPVQRWMTRSVYGIGSTENCLSDVLLSYLCTPCTVNQMYQTVFTHDNPVPQTGRTNNKRSPFAGDPDLARGCKVICCMPCLTGELLEESMGMPWQLGCCFSNLCMARNLIRYQYRIKPVGDECFDECFMPSCVNSCASLCLLPCLPFAVCPCLPCAWCVYAGVPLTFGAYVAFYDATKRENERRAPYLGKGYLVGYDYAVGEAYLNDRTITDAQRRAAANGVSGNGSAGGTGPGSYIPPRYPNPFNAFWHPNAATQQPRPQSQPQSIPAQNPYSVLGPPSAPVAPSAPSAPLAPLAPSAPSAPSAPYSDPYGMQYGSPVQTTAVAVDPPPMVYAVAHPAEVTPSPLHKGY